MQYSLTNQSARGRDLFEAKGCVRCHTGDLALDRRTSRVPFYSGFVAAMWNHNQRLTGTEAKPTYDELQVIAAYLWCAGLFDGRGDAARGQLLYAKLSCGSCHGSGQGAPVLLDAAHRTDLIPLSVYFTVAAWNHGPAMSEQMEGKNITWPKFTDRQLADLGAYLQESPAPKRRGATE